MKISFKDQILPHLLALVVFYSLVFFIFRPMLFDGQELNQHDILAFRGSAQELMEYREATGEEGLWVNAMFSGMPAYLINVEWSKQALNFLHTVFSGGLPHPIRAIFTAMLSAYIMLLCFGVRPYLALVGGICFGLSSYLLIGIGAGHNGRIIAIAYSPMVVGALHQALKKPRWFSFAFFAVALALHLRANHLQITYYLILFLAPYGIIQVVNLFRAGDTKVLIRSIGGIALASVLALLTFLGSFLTTLEYSKYSIRGASELSKEEENSNFSQEGLSKSYAFAYSNGIGEPMTLLVPNYVGGSTSESFVSDPESQTTRFLRSLAATDQQQAQQLARYAIHYWGIQNGAAPYYAGAIMVLLFVIGIVYAPRQYSIWLVAMALFGVMLSWGSSFKGFNYFMFDYFPGYNKFRSVTFAIYITILSIALLGGLGLEEVFRRQWESKSLKKLLYVMGGVAGFLLLLWITGGFGNFQRAGEQNLPQGMQNALMSDRKGLFRADVLRSLLFILAAGSVIWLALRKKLKENVAALILVALSLFDMMGINQRVFGEGNFQRSLVRQYFQPDAADQSIMNVAGPVDRVINLDVNVWADATTSYHHASIGGYHGAKMRRYQDLIDNHMGTELQTMIGNLNARRSLGDGTPVLNMLNAKYIRFTSQGGPVAQENAQALGAAWFAANVQAVNSPDEEIEALGTLDLSTTAVIDQSKFPTMPEGGAGTITITEHNPGSITYNLNVTDAGLAVFSEVYYPEGWVATLDGEPVDIYRVNYILRGVSVPEGQHTLQFNFKPRSYTLGNSLNAISTWLLLLLFITALVLEVRGLTNQPEEKEAN